MTSLALSNDDKLRRVLFLSSNDSRYTAGEPDKYSLPTFYDNPKIFDEYVNNISDFLKCIHEVSESNSLPRRGTLFSVIAKFLSDSRLTPQAKNEICLASLKLIHSDDDLFDLVMYTSKFRSVKTKIPTTLRKIIKEFYNRKSPEELVKSYLFTKSRHGWTHKTLFKLTHYKPETPLKNVIVKYIMLQNISTDNIDDEHAKKLITKLKSIDELRMTNDVGVAVRLIENLKANMRHLNSHLYKQPQVWESVIPHMTTHEILKSLPNLYKFGFLKSNKQITTSIVRCLTDLQRVKASKIHPIEVFIYQKNFERGGRPIDPKLYQHLVIEKKLTEEKLAKLKETPEPKCPPVMNAIHKCMAMSYNSVKCTNKKFLITIDVTEKMESSCIHNKNITAIEAALSITMFYVKVEKDVTIATFNDKEIKFITIAKGDHFSDNLKKLKEQKSTYIMPLASVDWAFQKKKHFDVFINFVHTADSILAAPKEIREKPEKVKESIKKYQETVNQNAKFVFHCLAYNRLHMIEDVPDAITIMGLDNDVPKLLQAFISGKFC